jgi:hypothetical protein
MYPSITIQLPMLTAFKIISWPVVLLTIFVPLTWRSWADALEWEKEAQKKLVIRRMRKQALDGWQLLREIISKSYLRRALQKC